MYRRGLTFYSFNSFHLFKAMILKIDFFFQEKKDINLSGSWQDGVEILIAMGNKKKWFRLQSIGMTSKNEDILDQMIFLLDRCSFSTYHFCSQLIAENWFFFSLLKEKGKNYMAEK